MKVTLAANGTARVEVDVKVFYRMQQDINADWFLGYGWEDGDGHPLGEGWYIGDTDAPVGPFNTQQDAIDDALA